MSTSVGKVSFNSSLVGKKLIQIPFWLRHLLWTPELHAAGPNMFATHRGCVVRSMRGEASAGGDVKEQHGKGQETEF